MGGGVVPNYFANGPGMQEKYSSKVRAGFEDTCKYVIPQKRTRRTLVLLGCSGNGKSATGNSILGKEEFVSKGRAAAVTKECELKTTKRPNGHIINVIDTPGLFSLFPSNEFTIREIVKCFSLAKEGINAVLMVFSLRSRLTEEEKSVLFMLKNVFGSYIVNYMIIVFTNEDSLEDTNETMEDYLEGCPDFKEILAACNNRMVLFDNRTKASDRKKAKQVQTLLDLVEVVRKNNKKPFMFDVSHKTMENKAVYKEKQKNIRAMKGHHCTKQEMPNWKKEAEKSPKDQLTKMVEKGETRLKEVTQSMLEQELTEEKNARVEAEKRANESNKEIEKLKEKLKEAEEELNKKGGSCVIL